MKNRRLTAPVFHLTFSQKTYTIDPIKPPERGFKLQKIMAIINFFKAVAGEFKHVVWPSRRQMTIFTIIVIIISVAAGYYLGLFDLIFARLFEIIL